MIKTIVEPKYQLCCDRCGEPIVGFEKFVRIEITDGIHKKFREFHLRCTEGVTVEELIGGTNE